MNDDAKKLHIPTNNTMTNTTNDSCHTLQGETIL